MFPTSESQQGLPWRYIRTWVCGRIMHCYILEWQLLNRCSKYFCFFLCFLLLVSIQMVKYFSNSYCEISVFWTVLWALPNTWRDLPDTLSYSNTKLYFCFSSARHGMSHLDTTIEGTSDDMTVVDAASLRRQVVNIPDKM